TREFVALRQLTDIDPASPRIIEAQKRLKEMLADFLYESATALTALREQVNNLADGSTDQAQDHRVLSWLTRGFHALQAAHHRFEFAASDVQISNNFRLAATLRSAQGLRQRTVLRRRVINQHLTQIARRQVALDRQNQIADLESRIEQLAAEEDESLRGLLALQDQHDKATRSMEEYAVKRTQSDIAGERINELTVEIDDTRQRLQELADQRPPSVDPSNIRLVACSVSRMPANLTRRLAYGWAAFVTCLLVLMVFFSPVSHTQRNS
ncbi:MAG: hypothetical protein ACE5GE_01175, partial [Phycisphaerae bacterium]